MLSIWNPLVPNREKSDSKISSKDYFDRLFDLTINDFFTDLYPRNLGIDSKEENNNLILSIDVPGMKEKDLSVELKGNFLNIKGERKNKGSYYSINKSFTIPDKFNPETLKAELADGVLTFSLEKKSKIEDEIRKIEIISPQESLDKA